MLSQQTRSSLEAFATQAALAIESARLYAEAAEKARIERDLRVAAEIQQALLPEPDVRAPSSISRRVRAVPDGWRRLLRLPRPGEQRFGFALGDVAGKGPPAALLAAAVQSNFVAQAPVSGEPADTMARHQQRPAAPRHRGALRHDVLRCRRRRRATSSYCNAGQEPPLVFARAAWRWLETGGPVLGLLRRRDLRVRHSARSSRATSWSSAVTASPRRGTRPARNSAVNGCSSDRRRCTASSPSRARAAAAGGEPSPRGARRPTTSRCWCSGIAERLCRGGLQTALAQAGLRPASTKGPLSLSAPGGDLVRSRRRQPGVCTSCQCQLWGHRRPSKLGFSASQFMVGEISPTIASSTARRGRHGRRLQGGRPQAGAARSPSSSCRRPHARSRRRSSGSCARRGRPRR